MKTLAPAGIQFKRISQSVSERNFGRNLRIGVVTLSAIGIKCGNVEIVIIAAQASHHAQVIRCVPGCFGIRADGTFGNFVIGVLLDEFALVEVGHTDALRIVITEIDTGSELQVAVVYQQLVGAAAYSPALVELAELEVVGWVRFHGPVVSLCVDIGVPVAAFELAGQYPAFGRTICSRIE